MTAMTAPGIPTAKLVIEWPEHIEAGDDDAFNDYANDCILSKAAELIVAGERPAFEVWFAGIPGRPDTTAADFDAIEVSPLGVITTLPPYAELEAAGA